MSSRKHSGMFQEGNTLASRGRKTRGPNITISNKQSRGRTPINTTAVAALLASTYRDMDTPCPVCGQTQIECTTGDGKQHYWCVNMMCAYGKIA